MELWVFDNDGTLYDDRAAHVQFTELLMEYVHEKFRWSKEEAIRELSRLKRKFQTESSIIGLVRGRGVSFEEAVAQTYLRINLEECNLLKPDFERQQVLRSLPGKKIVLTNNPSQYAKRVLSHVGLAEYFTAFIGMAEAGFFQKPAIQPFAAAARFSLDHERITICDDSLENLATAASLGWRTVWYSPSSAPLLNSRHAHIVSFEDILEVN